MLLRMSLETQVQNLASETARRWKSLRSRDAQTRAAARDVLAKLTFGAWLLAGNLLRTSIGRRVPSQRLIIRRFQQRLQDRDEDHLLAQLDHAVAAVLWHLVVARRDGIHLRRVERLVAEFVDAAEVDLAKLSRAEKT
jgi:di/tricarboxylate transporter